MKIFCAALIAIFCLVPPSAAGSTRIEYSHIPLSLQKAASISTKNIGDCGNFWKTHLQAGAFALELNAPDASLFEDIPQTAYEEEPPVVTYALINSEITLYSDTLLTRAVCTLPATYFVIVLEARELFMRVSYYDITGYIHPLGVEIVDYEPVTKYATVFRYFVNNDGYPATLRSAPDHLADNRLQEIPTNGNGMYYGTALGSSIIAEVGNLWYYVKYETTGGKVNGYVYKSQISVEKIEPNKIERVKKPPADSAPKSPFEFNDWLSVVIIAALTLPAALITLLIFRKPKERNARFTDDKR